MSATWSNGLNWDGGIAAPANDLTTDIARFNKTVYVNEPNSGTRSIKGIEIGDGTTATATLTLTTTALSIGASGITMFANAGAATITAGSVKIGANQSWSNNSSNLLTISSAVTNNGNTTPFTLTLNGSGMGGTTLSGVISDGGTTGTTALVVNRANGVTTFSQTNTFTGGTTLTLGTLQLSGSGTLGGASNTLTVNGGVVDLNGTSQGVGNFTGSGGTILNNNTGTNATLTIGNNDATGGNYSGVIADHSSGTGTIALTKTGTGTLTLSGANTFTGATSIGRGTLALSKSGGGALGSTSSVTVNSGGTLLLGANDQINNSAGMTLAGGTFSKGDFSEGATNAAGVGALTLSAAGSHIDFGTGTVGTLTFASLNASSFTLTIDNWTGTANTVGTASTDRLIFSSDQTSNLSAFNFTGYSGAVQFTVGSFYEIVPLTAVPEPSSYFVTVLISGVICYHQMGRGRKKRKRVFETWAH